MNWLKRKVIKWVREDWDSVYKKNHEVAPRSIDSEHVPDEDPVLTFRIYSAVNGKIIEFRRWDQKADRNHNSTYLVPKDEDMGEYINKCLSLEMLK